MNYVLKIILKLGCFLIAELYLNWLGLDDLANYSEFIFEKNLAVVSASQSLIINFCSYLEKGTNYLGQKRSLNLVDDNLEHQFSNQQQAYFLWGDRLFL